MYEKQPLGFLVSEGKEFWLSLVNNPDRDSRKCPSALDLIWNFPWGTALGEQS